MQSYDRSFPLIVIHIPKAAGTSVRTIFNRWYGDKLIKHYFNSQERSLPQRRNLLALHSSERPVAVYGHFNRLRNLGIEEYYPEVQQFITILRDPFERAISSYYYLQKRGANFKDQWGVARNDLRTHLMGSTSGYLVHFPREVTKDNYKEQIEELFIEVGVMERLSESVQRIAGKLNMPFDPEWLPHLNATERDQVHPGDLWEEYAERHALEYEVYNHVASRFKGQAGDCAQRGVPADPHLPLRISPRTAELVR